MVRLVCSVFVLVFGAESLSAGVPRVSYPDAKSVEEKVTQLIRCKSESSSSVAAKCIDSRLSRPKNRSNVSAVAMLIYALEERQTVVRCSPGNEELHFKIRTLLGRGGLVYCMEVRLKGREKSGTALVHVEPVKSKWKIRTIRL